MAYHLDVRFACPKHPGFRPQMGEPGIIGGCQHCWRIVRFYYDWLALIGQVSHLIVPKRRRKEAA